MILICQSLGENGKSIFVLNAVGEESEHEGQLALQVSAGSINHYDLGYLGSSRNAELRFRLHVDERGSDSLLTVLGDVLAEH